MTPKEALYWDSRRDYIYRGSPHVWDFDSMYGDMETRVSRVALSKAAAEHSFRLKFELYS